MSHAKTLECQGCKTLALWKRHMSLTFKVFPPTIIQELKKNSGTIMSVERWEKWFLVNFIAHLRLVGSCNDSMGEFIRRLLNTVTLLKFTGHWDVMGLVRYERQTNVLPKNISQELAVQKSLAMVGWGIRKMCRTYLTAQWVELT